MKTLKIKDIEENTILPPTMEQNYKGMILHCINQQPQGGITVDDMTNRMRIKNKVMDCNGDGEIEFEDADSKALIGYVNDSRWASVEQGVLDFVADVKALKDQE